MEHVVRPSVVRCRRRRVIGCSVLCYLLTVLISISSGIDNHSASIQVHSMLYVTSLCPVYSSLLLISLLYAISVDLYGAGGWRLQGFTHHASCFTECFFGFCIKFVEIAAVFWNLFLDQELISYRYPSCSFSCCCCWTLSCRRRRHRVASSGRRVAPPWPCRMACLSVSRGWQEQIQCRCGVGLSSEREDDQDNVSSHHQLNDRMLDRLGNVGCCVLETAKLTCGGRITVAGCN